MRNIALLYSYRFFGECVPIIPFLGIVYAEAGLSLSAISTIFLVLSVTVLVFEIPTGIFTDHVSVKFVLILSRALKCTSFIFLYFFPTFIGFVIATILWGLASSFDSGAFQSYVYTLMRTTGNEKQFEIVFGNAMTAGMIGLLTASVIGSQLHILSLGSLQIMGIAFLGLSTLTSIALPKIPKQTSTPPKQVTGYFNFYGLKTVLQYITQRRVLLLLLCVGVATGGFKGSLDEFTSLLLSDKGLSLSVIGIVLLVLEIPKSSGAFIARYIPITTSSQSLYVVLFGLSFIAAGLATNIFIVISMLIGLILIDSIVWIKNDIDIQRNADDTNRATLASIKNFGTELIAGLVFLIVASLQNSISLGGIYAVVGGTIVCIGASTYLLFNRDTKARST